MTGLINQPRPSPPAEPPDDATGSLVQRTQRQVQQSVPPTLKKTFAAIVVAGKKLMFSDQTFKFTTEYLNRITTEADIPPVVAHGIVKLISIVLRESQRPADLNDSFYAASFPAALVLMGDALEYVEEQRQLPVSQPILDATTTQVTGGLFKMYGITKEVAQRAWQDAQARRAQPTGA